ncbi:hypothetical protein LCM19_02885 [Qipengyuania flava]|nr:hypothetical protein [Qipengyuania flava]
MPPIGTIDSYDSETGSGTIHGVNAAKGRAGAPSRPKSGPPTDPAGSVRVPDHSGGVSGRFCRTPALDRNLFGQYVRPIRCRVHPAPGR